LLSGSQHEAQSIHRVGFQADPVVLWLPASRSGDAFDPNVWSGRALQEGFVEWAVSGLASMYPAFDLSSMGSWP